MTWYLRHAEVSGRHPEMVIRKSGILGVSGNLENRQFSSVASQTEWPLELTKRSDVTKK
jgi:hypothetical protein